ncbi:MAG: preprotein translocase subunit SecG [Thermodesulfovibrionales bacterium]
MTTVLVILHIMVSLLLIFIVLIQGGKGAELGAAFGAGSSQTLFGGRGAATLLNKMTTVVAVVFMVTSLLLAIASTRTASVIKETSPLESSAPETGPVKLPPAAQGEAPVSPAPEAPAGAK